MRSNNQLLGKLGGKLVTSAVALTGKNISMIFVAEAATFTVLKEKNTENETAVDVMAEQNATGLEFPAGVQLTPKRNMFSDVTISAGKLYVYFNN